MKKGQISLETVFAVGMVLLLFIIILVFSFVKKQEAIKTEQFIEARAECLQLADAFNSMLTLGTASNFSMHLYYKHQVLNTSIIRTRANDSRQEIAFCNYLGIVGPYANLTGDIHVQNVAGNISVVMG